MGEGNEVELNRDDYVALKETAEMALKGAKRAEELNKVLLAHAIENLKRFPELEKEPNPEIVKKLVG